MTDSISDCFFVRLHTPPRGCRNKEAYRWGAKEQYLHDKSKARYARTKDGMRMAASLEEMRKSGVFEIGRVESFRFVESLI